MWAILLRSALGTYFTGADELFLEHAPLVNSAEIIAHVVLGLGAEELAPCHALSGDRFTIGFCGVVAREARGLTVQRLVWPSGDPELRRRTPRRRGRLRGGGHGRRPGGGGLCQVIRLVLTVGRTLRLYLREPELAERTVHLTGDLSRNIGPDLLEQSRAHVDEQPGITTAELDPRDL
jgi:hypothetical protein